MRRLRPEHFCGTYLWKIPGETRTPRCATDPFLVRLLVIIRPYRDHAKPSTQSAEGVSVGFTAV